MVVFHWCHVPLCVANVDIRMICQILGLFKCFPTRFPVIIDVFTYIVEDPCDVVHVELQLTLGVESSCTTPTWDFQTRVVNLLMRRQMPGLFKCLSTRFPTFVDVVTYVMEDPCDEVHMVLQTILAVKSSGTTCTWDFQLRVVLLLMQSQFRHPFKRPPTRFPIFVDVVTYVMVDLFVYVVCVLFQFTPLTEGSVTSQIRAFPWLCAFRLLRRCFVHYNWNRVST